MNAYSKLVVSALVLWGASQPVLAANEAAMMTTCNTYAARHLRVSTSDIVDLK